MSLEIPGFADLVEIGRGGMSTVYSARDIVLDRPVALKVLTAELAADPGFRARFKREWKLVASFDHPHIVPVYAAGQVADRMYLAMRLVPGLDLGRLVARDGPLGLGRTASLIGQVAAALNAAHAAGLVHRDVKPRNVLIERRGSGEHCWLSDFGITKEVGGAETATMTGGLLLTAHYASPEQVRGGRLDARTDVYALGCLVFKCLTGSAPFVRDSEAGVLAAHLVDLPEPVTRFRPELSQSVDYVVSRALAKDPAGRYPTAGALAVALRQSAEEFAAAQTLVLRDRRPAERPPAPRPPTLAEVRPQPVQPLPRAVRPPAGPLPPYTGGSAAAPSRLGSWSTRRWLALAAVALVGAAAVVVGSVTAVSNAVSMLRDSPSTAKSTASVASPRFTATISGVAVDGRGAFYLAMREEHRVIRLDRSGMVKNLAGIGSSGFSGDGGPATAARLGSPEAVAVDEAGNVYIADYDNNRVRKVDGAGTITTVAGTGTRGATGDGGPATYAQIDHPAGVVPDRAGNLFIVDYGNERVRKVDSAGTIRTVAGTGTRGLSGDNGAAVDARLKDPVAAAVDGAGNLYIVDLGNSRVRKVSRDGVIVTVAGTGTDGFSGDHGPAVKARLDFPTGIALDRSGRVIIVDNGNERIRRIDSRGTITTVAGTGSTGFSGDNGPGTRAQLASPLAVAVDRDGAIYVADTLNRRIRKVAADGKITTVAGSGPYFPGDNGPATRAQVRPVGIDVTQNDEFYLADYDQNRVRKVTRSGQISTVTGNGKGGFSGEKGPANRAQVDQPEGVAVDRAGNLFIADTGNHCIRRVDKAGLISTVVGTGTDGFLGDGGPATRAQISGPRQIVIDGAGNLFFADNGNSRIRKVDTSGRITTIVGAGGEGFSGDGGPASRAKLNLPSGVAVDTDGNVYIADTSNNRIRRVDRAGTIRTIAGTGVKGFAGDNGPATAARLSNPEGVTVDNVGNVYIADSSNNRVRRVDRAGRITTVAGIGTESFSGDGGPASAAGLDYPVVITFDSVGNMYISDLDNSRIRRIDRSGKISTFAGLG